MRLAEDEMAVLLRSKSDVHALELVFHVLQRRYGVEGEQLLEKSRVFRIALIRHIGAALVRDITEGRIGLKPVARHFGYGCHTTVLHAERRIMKLRQGNDEFDREYCELLEELHECCERKLRTAQARRARRVRKGARRHKL